MSGDAVVSFVGNVADTPELRFTPAGAAVSSFQVAVSRRVKDDAGVWSDASTTFYRCSVWRQYAENVAESLARGDRVMVTGDLRPREYESTDPTSGAVVKRLALEVDVTDVGLCLRFAPAKSNRPARSATPELASVPL